MAEPKREQAWKWNDERLAHEAKCRVSARQRLRIVEAAIKTGLSRTELIRRALLLGLEQLEHEQPEGQA